MLRWVEKLIKLMNAFQVQKDRRAEVKPVDS